MPEISLTTFVDYTSGTGTGRITTVRKAKKQYEAEYNPAFDYYKQLREAIEKTVKKGWNAKDLQSRLKSTHPGKIENYEICRKGFSKWVGRKSLKALKPISDSWTSGDLVVRINPELHVKIGDQPTAVKLHFKADPLSKAKLDVALHLLRQIVPEKSDVAVLDVRRSKLFVPTREIADIDALLVSEALALSNLWKGI